MINKLLLTVGLLTTGSVLLAQHRFTVTENTAENPDEVSYLYKGSEERSIKFLYDGDGRRTNSSIFDKGGNKVFEASKLYTGSKDLNQSWYTSDGKTKQKLVYKYDDSGNLKKIYNHYRGNDDYFYVDYNYSGGNISGVESHFIIGGKEYATEDLSTLSAF